MLRTPQPILAAIAAERAAGTADHLIRVVVSFNQQGAMTVNRYRRGTPAHSAVIVANMAPHDQLPTSPLLVVDSPIVGAAPWDVLGVERRNLVQPFGLEPT